MSETTRFYTRDDTEIAVDFDGTTDLFKRARMYRHGLPIAKTTDWDALAAWFATEDAHEDTL